MDLSFFKEDRNYVFNILGQNLINLILSLMEEKGLSVWKSLDYMSNEELFRLEDSYRKALESKGISSEIPVRKFLDTVKTNKIIQPDLDMIMKNMVEFFRNVYPEDEEKDLDDFLRGFSKFLDQELTAIIIEEGLQQLDIFLEREVHPDD